MATAEPSTTNQIQAVTDVPETKAVSETVPNPIPDSSSKSPNNDNTAAPTTEVRTDATAAPTATPADQSSASTSIPTVNLRAPSTLNAAVSTSTNDPLQPPKLTWLEGTWHVTHSTLPMWKKNKNVTIKYSRVANTKPAHIDDLVSYSPINGKKLKTVHGVDKPFLPSNPPTAGETKEEGDGTKGEDVELASLGYQWRGKGLLAIASSKWELLGYGEEPTTGNKWAVTFFQKTLFTPAGIDIYSWDKEGLKKETVEGIKKALLELGEQVKGLAGKVFEIKHE